MNEWMLWFVLVGAALIVEMFTGTFYLLMLSIGLAAGGVTALAGFNNTLQLVVAAIVGICATYALRRNKLGKPTKLTTTRDPNVNFDIGNTLEIQEWHAHVGDSYTARAMYRGAMWDIQLEHGASAELGTFIITEIHGSKLIVKNNKN